MNRKNCGGGYFNSLKSKASRYLPVFIILLSLTIICGSTFAYFTDKADKDSSLTFSKVELSSETTTGVNGVLKDVIPGTPLVDGALSFSKSIDSEAIYVRAKISFSLPTEYATDEDMLSLINMLRSSTDFNINTEEQNNAVWSAKDGNYFYLVTSADATKLMRVDTIDTYTLSNEVVVPRDLEQLDGNAQYMKSINFHIAFEAIQADNVSDVLSETKETFNAIFPEKEAEKYVEGGSGSGDETTEVMSMTMNGDTYTLYSDGSGDFVVMLDGDYTYLAISLDVTDELINSGTFTIDSMTINLDYTRVYKMMYDANQETVSIDNPFNVTILNYDGSDMYVAGIGIDNITDDGNSYYLISINFVGETLGTPMDGDDGNVERILSMDMNGGIYTAYTDGSGDFIYYGANNEGSLMINLYVTDVLITSGTFTIDSMDINQTYTGVAYMNAEGTQNPITDLTNINVDIINNPQTNQYMSNIIIMKDNNSVSYYVCINFVGETLGSPMNGGNGGNGSEFAELIAITMNGNTYTAYGDRKCDFIVDIEGSDIYLQINMYVTDEYITNGVLTIDNMVIYIPYTEVVAFDQTMETVAITEFDNISMDIIGNPDPEENQYLSAVMITGESCNIMMTINFVGETLGTPVYDYSETELVNIFTMVINGLDLGEKLVDDMTEEDMNRETRGEFTVCKDAPTINYVTSNKDVTDEIINGGILVIRSIDIHIPYTEFLAHTKTYETVPITVFENINLDIVHHPDPQVNKYTATFTLVCENITIHFMFNLIGETLGINDMPDDEDQLTHIQINCRDVELYKNYIEEENHIVSNFEEFVFDERTNTAYYFGELSLGEYQEFETLTIDSFNFNHYSLEDAVFRDDVLDVSLDALTNFEVGVETIDGKQIIRLSVEYEVYEETDYVKHYAIFKITLKFDE